MLIVGRTDDVVYRRAAGRWLARLVLERPDITLEDLRAGLNILEACPYNPDAARKALWELCGRYELVADREMATVLA